MDLSRGASGRLDRSSVADRCREATGQIAGIGWYPDKNIRLMANGIRAEADGSPAVGRREIRADIAEFRLQLYR